jgi:D-sedoheptulose 7-phosphate isomerase
MSWIDEQLDAMSDLARALREDPQYAASLERTCQMVVDCLERGGKVLTLGNGGSATDALHLAEELIGRFRTNRRPLPAICLAADTSALTCIGNDFGFDQIFSRQVEALCAPGDVVIAFTTSGNSENIVLALQAAKAKGGRTVGMLGRGGGRSLPACDEAFVVPHQNTARIQEMHTLALHVICEAVERKFGQRD